jgi:hypothetical protein
MLFLSFWPNGERGLESLLKERNNRESKRRESNRVFVVALF